MEYGINEYGVFIGDVYVLNYYGVLVFFRVCETRKETVFLVELGTKKYKNGIMLRKGLKASKTPLVVLKNNTYSKTNFEVKPIKLFDEQYWLPIEVKYGDPLHKEACKYHEFPSVGFVYAVPLEDYLNKYWENDKVIIEKEKPNISA